MSRDNKPDDSSGSRGVVVVVVVVGCRSVETDGRGGGAGDDGHRCGSVKN